ncbi:MAG: hypothetical protein NZ805_08200 [Armatimonadetes bacterium]|nr:hypothetical protein [Armatimonadota bacterium]MDW8027411.1 hypothetical protein [Armatimonadota bacterium]
MKSARFVEFFAIVSSGRLSSAPTKQCQMRKSYPKELVKEVRLDFLPLVDTKAVLAEFVSALREKRNPECSAQDNLKILAMVFGAIESAKRKQWVEIEELFENHL